MKKEQDPTTPPSWKVCKLYQTAHPRTPWRVIYKQGGKRVSKWFRLKKAALEFGGEKDVELLNLGSDTVAVTAEEMRAIRAWRSSPQPPPARSLEDVVRDYLARHKDRGESVTLQDGIDSLMQRREREGKAGKTLIDLKYRLERLRDRFGGGVSLAELGTRDLDKWIGELSAGYSPQSVKNFRRVAHGLFSHAEGMGWVMGNPVKKAMNPKVKHGEVGIYRVAEARAMLENCEEDALAALVLSMFSGLRTAEICQVEWSQVNLAQGHIRLLKTKTGRPRIAPIPSNAAAWLRPLMRSEGRVVTVTERVLNERWKAAREAAEIQEALPNAGRHSFGSYRAAMIKDLPRVAFEMGNSVAMVQRHYQEIVTAAEAKKYFGIVPAGVPKNVVVMNAAGGKPVKAKVERKRA
jgi:integrase